MSLEQTFALNPQPEKYPTWFLKDDLHLEHGPAGALAIWGRY